METVAKKWNAWSEADDATLRALISEHLSYAEIGAKMGRNKNACIGRAHRLGIQNSHTKPAPQKKAKQPPIAKTVLKLFPATPSPAPAQDNRPRPRYEQPEASTTPFGTPRTLMALQPHHCRWPVSGERADTLFCGATREGHGPYCTEHRLVAWRPTNRQIAEKAYR